jgi:hypothetical protein
MSETQFKVAWIDGGREPTEPSDPRYPQGIDLDVAAGKSPNCLVSLPYPARRCGMFFVDCRRCGMNALVTAAGRPDDPRSIKIPCKIKYDS